MNIKNVVTSDEFQQGGYFPLEYYVEFIQYLKNNKKIEIITYDDMAWAESANGKTVYETEKYNWEKKLESGERDPKKIYVLLQHDVDSRPERSMRLIQEEIAVGVRSNVMIFARRHNRKELKNNWVLQYTDYNLDSELLKRAEKEFGFVIGYHCNAYEQALYNLNNAQQRMIDDVKVLRKEYDIKFWSAHGGVAGPENINNNKMIPPDVINASTIWVHNGSSPFFDGNYSDGGLNNKKRDPRNRNISDFVTTWKPGKRYRILTHPQYFSSPPQYNEWLATADWYKEIFSIYDKTGSGGWKTPKGKHDFYEKIKFSQTSIFYRCLNYIRKKIL